MFKYSIQLAWSDEDSGYIATVPELPGLSAFGESTEEAAQEAVVAAYGFIEVLKEDGDTIPEPYKHSTYSGQTRLRLPKSLHAALSQEAKREGVSLNTHILRLLAERHQADQITKEVRSLKPSFYSIAFNFDTAIAQSSTSPFIMYEKICLGDYDQPIGHEC